MKQDQASKIKELSLRHRDLVLRYSFSFENIFDKTKTKKTLTDSKLRMVFLHCRKFVIQWFVIYTGVAETDRKE